MSNHYNTYEEPPRCILDRWPTHDLFYRERDDRTRLALELSCPYADREVAIFVDPEEADLLKIQIMALVVCNLTSRWARNIVVFVPDKVPLCPQTKRDNHEFLDQRISFEMTNADPFGSFECSTSFHALNTASSRLRIFIGTWNSSSMRNVLRPADFVVGCEGWSILTNRGKALPQMGGEGRSSAPIAALAGSLGAADLFKRAIGHPSADWIPTLAWNVKSHQLSSQHKIDFQDVADRLDVNHMLLAGAGAIGSSLVYILDMMEPIGRLTVLDRDRVETSNLNRSPVFTVYDALFQNPKTDIAKRYLERHSNLSVSELDGTWHEHGRTVAQDGFDVWFSFTNEDGAWAEVPFQLPPVVFQATTTSGWGFGAGRHVPRIEDCTLCRLPRPETEFRGPCSEGDIAITQGPPTRAALPFLSTAAGSLVLAEFLKFSRHPSTASPNEISADLRYGLPAVMTLHRLTGKSCRGCQAMVSPIWCQRGGLGRFHFLSRT